MTAHNLTDGFTFSEGFDRIFLDELYGGDTRTAEEIFGTSIAQVGLSMQLAEIESRSDDPLRLRRVIHHAKPLFGYMGLLALQDAAQQLEDLCAPGADMDTVRAAFAQLRSLVDDAMERVRAEQERLHRHNNRRA
jgi:HPt (histidine-containing phosphotransfer) domain-containing protein